MKIIIMLMFLVLPCISHAYSSESTENFEVVDQKLYVDEKSIEICFPNFILRRNDQMIILERLRKDEKGVYFLNEDVLDIGYEKWDAYHDSNPYPCRDCDRRFETEYYRDRHGLYEHHR